MSSYYNNSPQWDGEYMTDYEKLEKARKEVRHWLPNMSNPTHPSHVQPRAESVIDLCFKRSHQSKINALVGLGRSMNLVGKTFKLKEKYIYCTHYLQKENIKFKIVFEDELEVDKKIH